MVTIACILLFVLLNYAYLLAPYRLQSNKVKPAAITPSTQRDFTILVPFRNEENRLPLLLASISNLNYPVEQLQFIFINDASTDDSLGVIHRWRMQNGRVPLTIIDNIPNAKSPKKEAIQLAMGIVKTTWVLTTDADCILAPDAFGLLDAYITAQPTAQAIAGGVRLHSAKGTAHQFDRLDQLAMQGLTLAAFQQKKHLLNNAANWAFTTSVFQEIGGHRAHLHLASGDDIFMLHRLAEKGKEIAYLNHPNYIVETLGATSWPELFAQRLRWASKSAAYKNPTLTDLGYSTFLANLALVAAWICTAITPIFGVVLVSLYAIKFWIDYPILRLAVQHKLGNWPITTLLGVLFYPIWTALIAALSLLKIGFSWKGRRFRG